MKVLLINPPLCVHEFPHLALPTLKGYLKEQKIQCDMADYNVHLMDSIIDDGFEKVEKYYLTRGMRTTLPEIKRRFRDAREVFLSKEHVGKEDRAQKLINTYLRIAGSNIFDICFKPDSLKKIKEEYDRYDFYRSSNRIIRYLRERVREISEKDYKVIGISVPFTSQLYYALILGRAVKEALPEAKVVLGGPQISLFWGILTGHGPFRASYDGLLYGMGEKAIHAYINAVKNGEGFEKVPNLIYWDHDKITTNNAESIHSMDEIPLADFSDLPLDKYIYAKLPYQTSRGCYWSKCVFCSYRDNHKRYSIRKAEEVCEHLTELERRYGRHIFQFIDDAIHPSVLSKMADTILARKMKIRYDAYLRLDSGFTEPLCKKLAASGLKNVLFGMESANQRMLDLMCKGNTPENMLKVLKNMKAAGIQNILSCLIGFPTETSEEAWESIKFLKENRQWYYYVYIVHFGMISDMREHAELYGIRNLNMNDLIRYDDSGFTALGYPYETSTGMTVDEALGVIQKGRQELGITVFEDNFFT